MGTVWRLRGRSAFVALRRHGQGVRAGALTLTWLDDGVPAPPRVAYAVGRAVGNAVTRNRVRRRLRALVAESAERLAPGAYLVTASPGVDDLSFEEMRTMMSTALARLFGGERQSSGSGR